MNKFFTCTDFDEEKWIRTLDYMFHNGPRDSIEGNFSKLFLDDNKLILLNRYDTNGIYTICSPIPEKKDVEFITALENQANYLRSLSDKGAKFFLMWSGGIDSTCVFYTLLKYDIPFTVVFDKHSRIEYPKLAEEIRVRYPYVYTTIYKPFQIQDYTRNNPDIVYITGGTGNQLFGSSASLDFNYQQRQMLLKDVLENKLIDPDIIHFGLDSVLKLLNTDISNTTLSEYLWGVSFIYKYQTALLIFRKLDLWPYGPLKNTIHFFDTVEFQQYAMSHYKQNCDFELGEEMKAVMKDWIYSQNMDNEYRKLKSVERSLKGSVFRLKNDDNNYFNTYRDREVLI